MSGLEEPSEVSDLKNLVEIEKIDENLYRSKILWLPVNARGVFGGQVVAQALLAATLTIDQTTSRLHSLHSYFLAAASPIIPIIYQVTKLRDGRSYQTRSVTASQRGAAVFILSCSFQRPEPQQPIFQIDLPPDIPLPQDCPLREDVMADLLVKRSFGDSPAAEKRVKEYMEERRMSPVAIKDCKLSSRLSNCTAYWIRAKSLDETSPNDHGFQCCVLAYISDFLLIGTAAKALGQTWTSKKMRLGQMVSLDHSMWIYDSFDTSEWILHMMEATRASNGRGLVSSRMYQGGRLIAAFQQEGVVRSAI